MTEESEAVKDYIANWRACDIAEVAEHFIGMPRIIKLGDTERDFINPDQRVQALKLDIDDYHDLIELERIDSMFIHLGLKHQEAGDQFDFCPVLEISESADVNGRKKYLRFNNCFDTESPKTMLTNPEYVPRKGASRVPFHFLSSVTNHWLRMENSDVPGLFLANADPNQGNFGIQRLSGYHLSSTHNISLFDVLKSSIIEKDKRLEFIGFHLGVDMNKFHDPNQYSFTPVIQLKISKGAGDLIKLVFDRHFSHEEAFPGFVMDTDNSSGPPESGSMLFEFLLPCPSTCPD